METMETKAEEGKEIQEGVGEENGNEKPSEDKEIVVVEPSGGDKDILQEEEEEEEEDASPDRSWKREKGDH